MLLKRLWHGVMAWRMVLARLNNMDLYRKVGKTCCATECLCCVVVTTSFWLNRNLALRRLDRDVVRGHVPLCHDTFSIEGPMLIAIRTVPLPSFIMELILEVHGNLVVSEGKEVLLQAIGLLNLPLVGQELDNCITARKEMVPVAPDAILCVAPGYSLRVLSVPIVLCNLDLLPSCLLCEGWYQTHNFRAAQQMPLKICMYMRICLSPSAATFILYRMANWDNVVRYMHLRRPSIPRTSTLK